VRGVESSILRLRAAGNAVPLKSANLSKRAATIEIDGHPVRATVDIPLRPAICLGIPEYTR
jgi:hypothetical protein